MPRAAVLTLVLASLLCGCAELPSLEGRDASTVVQDTAGTRLGTALQPLLLLHPGRSGIVTLAGGHDAFAARVTLVQAAERTLDIQYYIWNDDVTGGMMFDAVRAAADRGVRVRLLLDDNNTAGSEPRLRALDAHPNIEVRLFNPFVHRRLRALDFLTDFRRVNRRMHNKSMTADNQVTVVGGRNIGDAYFDAGGGLLFVDLDVMAAGPVVGDVSRDFDRYWASGSSYPLERVVAPAEAAPVVPRPNSPEALAYSEAVARSGFVRDLLARRLPFEWAAVTLVSDDPAKGLGRAAPEDHIWNRLQAEMPRPAREVLLVSPYFVPTADGIAQFSALQARGVQVSVLTNALEATDVVAVHAGYAPAREPLLRAGVRLYEMKRDSAPPPMHDPGLAGSSASSLHAKTFAVDRLRLFVGSFNFDPRSARLNTELGFIIESPVLAGVLAEGFAANAPQSSYQVRLRGDELEWVEQVGGRIVVHEQEPNTGVALRLAVWFLSLLPIEGLL